MTRLIQFSNNATSKLSANISAADTSLTVLPGDGAKFPALTGTKFFMATLIKADGTQEIIKVTARSTDTFTFSRAAEPVAGVQTSYSFSAGDRIELRMTAKALSDELDRLDSASAAAVQNKSANFSITAADISDLFRVNTASGNITATLPALSSLTDNYDVIVSKVTGDLNTVTITASGTDTVNGAGTLILTGQYQSAWLVADRVNGTWTAINSGSGGSVMKVDAFTGDGTANPLTLSGSPGNKNNTIFIIGGVTQLKSSYSVSGNQLTPGGAISAGASVEVWWAQPVAINTVDASNVNYTPSGTGAIARTTESKLRDIVSVKDFGAVGDGVTDDSTAFANALLSGSNAYVPPGTYKITQPLTINGVFLFGDSANKAAIHYYGAAGTTAITIISGEKGAGFRFIDLESKVSGQSGIYAQGAVGIVLASLYVNNFDQYQLRIGNTSAGAGVYWSHFDNIRLRLDDAVNGVCGVLIDGGALPASNNNVLDNVTIGGNYQRPLWIKGDGNHVRAGDINWTRGNQNIISVITIEGSGNKVTAPYLEASGVAPATICTFGANSSGNEVEIWSVFAALYNMNAAVSDSGAFNKFRVLRKGANYSLGAPNASGQNLVVNSGFSIWRDANTPAGWAPGTARISKDTTNVRGGVASLTMTESATNSSIQAYLTDYFTSTYGGPAYPTGMLAGRDVTVGVWCKTTVAGAGGIKLWSLGTGGAGVGTESHSGSGNWELLTAHARMPADLTRAWIELRSHINNSAITGTVTFSEPFFVFGQEPIVATSRPINDRGGAIYGDIELYSVGSTATDTGMIKLGTNWLWVDPASGKLRIKTGARPANLATDGVVVGSQS